MDTFQRLYSCAGNRGEIAGQNDEIVILHCHHDSPFKSPVEDASGCAVVLALAKHFAKERDNKRKIVILFTSGHFYGSLGTRTFIRNHLNDIVPKVASAVAEIVRKTDNMSKEAIGLVEFPGFRLKMKTTKLGTRPVY